MKKTESIIPSNLLHPYYQKEKHLNQKILQFSQNSSPKEYKRYNNMPSCLLKSRSANNFGKIIPKQEFYNNEEYQENKDKMLNSASKDLALKCLSNTAKKNRNKNYFIQKNLLKKEINQHSDLLTNQMIFEPKQKFEIQLINQKSQNNPKSTYVSYKKFIQSNCKTEIKNYVKSNKIELNL